MAVKTGIDIVHIPRIARLLENEAAMRRMLHDSELANTEPQHIAGIVAAKEAFFKAFEMVPQWLEIEIKAKPNGKPIVILSSRLHQMVKDMDLSISHDNDYAVAQAVINKKGK